MRLRSNVSDPLVAQAVRDRYHIPPDQFDAKTVLDLGSNIGLTLADYRSMWPEARIVGVEMDEENAELSRENSGCEVLCFAVSGKGGWGSYDPTLWASNFEFNPAQNRGKLVSSYTLRQVIHRHFTEAEIGDGIDFVKMDIEGAEWQCMEHGEWAPLVRRLLVELHPSDSDPSLVGKAIAMLQDLGYTAVPHTVHPQAVWAVR